MSRSPTKFLESPMFTYEPTYNINEQLQFDRRPAAIYQDFNATADHEVWRILDNDNPNCTQFSKHIVDSHTLNKARSPTVRPIEILKPIPQHSTNFMQNYQQQQKKNNYKSSSPWTKSAERPTPEKITPQPFSFGFPSVFPQNELQPIITNIRRNNVVEQQSLFNQQMFQQKHQQHKKFINVQQNCQGTSPSVSRDEVSFKRGYTEEWNETLEWTNTHKNPKPFYSSRYQPQRNYEDKEGVCKLKYKEFSKQLKSMEKDGYPKMKEFALKALENAPMSLYSKICLDLADVAKRENLIDEARAWFKRVNEMCPHSAQGWLEHAKLEEECGQLEQCQKILALGLAYCQYNESLLIKGIKHQEARQNLPAARAFLARLRFLPPEKAWKTILEGALLEARAGNIVIARKIFKYLMKNVPRHGPIYYEAYRLEEKCEEYKRALEIVERGLQVNPRYGPLWFAAFHLHEKLAKNGDLSKLREAIQKAVTCISKELVWKVYFESAQIEERANNIDLARKAYVNSVIHSLKNLRWKVWMAGSRTELNADNISTAKKLLNRALEEVPNKTRAVVLIECARLEEFTGRLDKARQFLKRAQQEAKHEWKVFLESILLEMRAGDMERAIKEAKEALNIHRRTGRLWAVLIQLTHIEGEEKQLKVFGEALREVPKSGEVWCEGARIRLNPLSKKFNLDKARQYLQFAIKFTPQYGDSFIEFLRLEHLQKGPLIEEDAKHIEQLCVNADPNYGPLWFHCKKHPLDSTRQVLRNAKEMLMQELLEHKAIYQRSIIRQQSKNNQKDFEVNQNLRQKFITGLQSFNLNSILQKDTETRRKIIFGFSDTII